MARLSSESKAVDFVINVPYEWTEQQCSDKVKQFANAYLIDWAFILHNRDVNVDGVCKTPHFHLCGFSSDGKKHRLNWYLNRLAEIFETEKKDCFSAVIMKDQIERVQYLIHKNNPEKFQYNIDHIISSFDRKQLEEMLSYVIDRRLSIDYIIETVKECDTLTEVYLKLGLGSANMYRGIINDIFRDKYRYEDKKARMEAPF